MRTTFKTLSLLLLGVILTVGFAFAGGQEEAAGAAEEPTVAAPPAPAFMEYWQKTDNPFAWQVDVIDGAYHLIDASGTAILIQPYEQMVVTSAGAVEILYLVGGQEAIAAIGTSRSGIWPEEETSELPNVGGLSRPNFEQIVGFEPDLMIGNGMNSEVVSDLNGLQIPSIIHGTDTIAEIMNAVLVLGALSGREQAAIELVQERYATLETVIAALEEDPVELKGAFVYSTEPIMAFTGNSLPGEVLSLLGVENIAAGLVTEQPILTAEYILEQNPDFLLGAMSIRTPDDILNADSVILETRAGREQNIIIVPSQMILRPTPRVIDFLVELHDELALWEN